MILFKGGTIVDSGRSFRGYLLVDGEYIVKVGEGDPDGQIYDKVTRIVDIKGSYLLPGIIDDQVHFRQPGATSKADIRSESRAAAAGGVTSFMDMPNTNPQTITCDAWREKMEAAAVDSAVNYSFFMGATNSNIDEIRAIDKEYTPGVKVFMGSSTGGMLVDDDYALSRIFDQSESLVAIHSESEPIIRRNLEKAKSLYGDDIPVELHPVIRSAEACVRSTERAMELAEKYGTRLHVLHVSTADEVSLFSSSPLSEKRITAEACIPHIKYTDADYKRLGTRIKCNPAIKSSSDRSAIRSALLSRKIDIVATDHAPHLLSEKQNPYTSAPSGIPMIQHSLPVMLSEGFSVEDVVSLMANRVADLFHIYKRGYIREGYYADLTVVRQSDWVVTPESLLYKCGWSPLEGETLKWKVDYTMVSGRMVYENGLVDDNIKGKPLRFLKK